MLFRDFRRNRWRDQIVADGDDLKQWYSVRGSLTHANLPPDSTVEAEITRRERRMERLRTRLKETA